MAENKFYAQFGEDKILYNLFNQKTDGICVEVGGYDGVTGSNTYFFEQLGWKCLIVEPMPEYCKKIKCIRNCEVAEIAASDTKGNVNFYVAEGVETLSTMENDAAHFKRIDKEGARGIKEIRVKTDLLTRILLDRGISQVDFLTLDVEGHELSALSGLSFEQIKPRILIIEDNSLGASDEVKEFMSAHSYVRFKRTGCNDWYAVKGDEFATLFRILFTEFRIFTYVQLRSLKLFLKKIGFLAK
ncbi:MAG: FkbM family methyltransferase [Methylophilaceae bacterium]